MCITKDLKVIVIDVIDSITVPTWPNTSDGLNIIAIECDDTVTIGDIYNDVSKTFSKPVLPAPVTLTPVPTQPTNAELAQLVSDLQADLLIAGVI